MAQRGRGKRARAQRAKVKKLRMDQLVVRAIRSARLRKN